MYPCGTLNYLDVCTSGMVYKENNSEVSRHSWYCKTQLEKGAGSPRCIRSQTEGETKQCSVCSSLFFNLIF